MSVTVYTSITDVPDQDPGVDGDDSVHTDSEARTLLAAITPPAPKQPPTSRVLVVPLPREIHQGMFGKDVRAVKRALRAWRPAVLTNATTEAGAGFVKAVKKFQQSHGLHVDGVYGKLTHAKLAVFFDSYGVWLLQHTHITTKRQLLQANALALYHYGQTTGRVHYTQSPLRMSIVRHKWKPPFTGRTVYEDCSSSLTGLMWEAGAPDPNGFGYNGQGYTGTLYNHGRRVQVPFPGDFMLCGNPPGHHVYMALGDDTRLRATHGWSHGSEGGPRLVNLFYRPVTSIHAYLAND